MVVVSEAAARAMLLAEKSGILPALFLPPVFFMLLVWRFSRLSGEDERKAKKKNQQKKNLQQQHSYLLASSFLIQHGRI